MTFNITATHNFKWVKITQIYLIWDKTFSNLDVFKPEFTIKIHIHYKPQNSMQIVVLGPLSVGNLVSLEM